MHRSNNVVFFSRKSIASIRNLTRVTQLCDVKFSVIYITRFLTQKCCCGYPITRENNAAENIPRKSAPSCGVIILKIEAVDASYYHR